MSLSSACRLVGCTRTAQCGAGCGSKTALCLLSKTAIAGTPPPREAEGPPEGAMVCDQERMQLCV